MAYQNVGGVDRSARIFFGILLLAADALLVPGSSAYSAIIAFVGVMVLLSGLLGFCILYVPFGFSTARKEVKAGACCDRSLG